ncbi:MAG: hypothetical protein HXY23_14025, partial [Parvularculaceae bacterium]|nr:hypothetical protein [Parvularculaceae bacterium]
DGTNTSVDTVTVHVNADDDAPSADAGPDQTAAKGSVIQLRAAAADVESQALTYEWVQTGGPTVTLNDVHAPNPTFVAPKKVLNEPITFELRVSDGTNTSVDTVAVQVVNETKPARESNDTGSTGQNNERVAQQTDRDEVKLAALSEQPAADNSVTEPLAASSASSPSTAPSMPVERAGDVTVDTDAPTAAANENGSAESLPNTDADGARPKLWSGDEQLRVLDPRPDVPDLVAGDGAASPDVAALAELEGTGDAAVDNAAEDAFVLIEDIEQNLPGPQPIELTDLPPGAQLADVFVDVNEEMTTPQDAPVNPVFDRAELKHGEREVVPARGVEVTGPAEVGPGRFVPTTEGSLAEQSAGSLGLLASLWGLVRGWAGGRREGAVDPEKEMAKQEHRK